ncbi:MAG: hypothetical protein ABR977_05320 [Candidatus Dormibacteria bacterium]|jgi:hypothetical protein
MSLGDWGLACLWLLVMLIAVAAVLGLVAVTDPLHRRAHPPAAGAEVPDLSGPTEPSPTGGSDPPA